MSASHQFDNDRRGVLWRNKFKRAERKDAGTRDEIRPTDTRTRLKCFFVDRGADGRLPRWLVAAAFRIFRLRHI